MPTLIPTDSGWQGLRPGLEKRLLRILSSEGKHVESVYILRLDPGYFRFAVAYSPGKPRTLFEWQEVTGALLVVNGGFYTSEFLATGLTIVDGKPYGRSFIGFGGMLAISESGPELRDLTDSPADPGEPLAFALQSFPVLLSGAGTRVFSQGGDERARRTVVAQDRSGNILFIVAPWGTFTLESLSSYLVESDLEIEVALNLDGGVSTGLLLKDPEEGYPAFARLPVVITVRPR